MRRGKAEGRRRIWLPAILCLSLFGVEAEGAATHVVVFRGPGGEPSYDQLFSRWVSRLKDQLKARADNLVILGPDQDAPATRQNIISTLEKFKTLGRADLLLLFLIGHGSSDQTHYRFNVPGPDITGEELSAALADIPAQVVVVNGTSSSGASLPVLSSKNRVVITATRSGRESVPPRFLGFVIEGLDGQADADKNGSVSLLELFQYGRGKTAEWYQEQNRLASEHAMLDDSGGGKGTESPAPGTADGALAASLIIVPAARQMQANVPKELLSRKQELEAGIERLRFQKSQMSEDDYQQQLERLLLELARVNRQIAAGEVP